MQSFRASITRHRTDGTFPYRPPHNYLNLPVPPQNFQKKCPGYWMRKQKTKAINQGGRVCPFASPFRYIGGSPCHKPLKNTFYAKSAICWARSGASALESVCVGKGSRCAGCESVFYWGTTNWSRNLELRQKMISKYWLQRNLSEKSL